jgi:hypothetical protein
MRATRRALTGGGGAGSVHPRVLQPPARPEADVDPRPLLLLCLLLAASGCRDEPADARISSERFVAANVALRTLPADATDEQRAAVLARYRVTPDDLRAWVQAHGDRPEALAAAWQQVAGRLDSLAEVGARTEEPGERPPPPGEIVDEPVPDVIKDDPFALPGRPQELELPGRARRERPTPPSDIAPPKVQ